MTEFIRGESGVESIRSFLVSNVFGFEESPEYQEMRDYELDIPGVVLGAFAKYLGRIHSQEAKGLNTPSLGTAISSAHEAIERLSASQTAVQNLITDEVFENLDSSPTVLDRMKAHLGPNALSLYTHWRSGRGT